MSGLRASSEGHLQRDSREGVRPQSDGDQQTPHAQDPSSNQPHQTSAHGRPAGRGQREQETGQPKDARLTPGSQECTFCKASAWLQLAGEGPQEGWSWGEGCSLWQARVSINREQLSPPTHTCGFSGPWTHRTKPQILPPEVRCGGHREHPGPLLHLQLGP